MSLSSPTALVAGAATAVAVERLGSRLSSERRTTAHGLGLVAAALVYPAARTAGRDGPAGRTELVAVATYTVATTAALSRRSRTARRLVAAGWASHALFDLVHDAGTGSRLPGWYPALCAGYDLAVARVLSRDPTTADASSRPRGRSGASRSRPAAVSPG